MFFSKKLQKIKGLKHCFFSRNHGFSKGYYKSLNCGLGSGDKRENVLKNLQFVRKKIGCNNNSLITLNQTHSTNVIFFKNKNLVRNKISGDAIVTKIKKIGIGVLTADCAPILFYDPKKKIIGCVHSGWKGALNGIIKNTIQKFNKLNSNNNDIIAVVGPCIKKENYEVKIDFVERFISHNQMNEIFFEKINNKKYIFDLRSFVNKELSNLHIKNIENIKLDTFSKPNFFYSYRRSCLNNERDYGRCISVILMT